MRRRGVLWIVLAVLCALIALPNLCFVFSDIQIAKSALRYYNNYDEAIMRLQRVLRKDPQSTEAHLYLGLAYGKKGDFEEAIKEFQWVRRNRPDFAYSAGTHNEIGVFYYVRESYREAIEEFKKAVSIDPRFAEAYFNMGSTCSAIGQAQDAISCYRKVIQLEPRHSYGHWNLAVNLEKAGDIEGAVRHWKKYMDLTPGVFINPDVNEHVIELEKELKKSRVKG
jgi:tetratricopeptide (TPR) repeat protein